MIVLLKLHRQETFTKELYQHQRGKEIDSRSKILALSSIIEQGRITPRWWPVAKRAINT